MSMGIRFDSMQGYTLKEVLAALEKTTGDSENSIEERLERLEATVAALTLFLGMKGEKDGDTAQVKE